MRYEVKVTEEYSDHVVVEADSEAEAKCMVEELVYDGDVSVIEGDGKGVRGGGFKEYDYRVEVLYPTDTTVTVKRKETSKETSEETSKETGGEA